MDYLVQIMPFWKLSRLMYGPKVGTYFVLYSPFQHYVTLHLIGIIHLLKTSNSSMFFNLNWIQLDLYHSSSHIVWYPLIMICKIKLQLVKIPKRILPSIGTWKRPCVLRKLSFQNSYLWYLTNSIPLLKSTTFGQSQFISFSHNFPISIHWHDML